MCPMAIHDSTPIVFELAFIQVIEAKIKRCVKRAINLLNFGSISTSQQQMPYAKYV